MKGFKLEHWKLIALCLVLYDIVITNGAYFMALFVRFELSWSAIPVVYLTAFYKAVPIYTVAVIAIFYFCKLYSSIWRYASYMELIRCTEAAILSAVAHTVIVTVIYFRMPFSYYIMGAITQAVLLVLGRFSYRFYNLLKRRREAVSSEAEHVMLVGAGDAGRMLLRDIQREVDERGRVVCIIDDNPNKWGRDIDGIPVVGGRESIPEMAEKYKIKRIYIAIPSATTAQRQELVSICNETDCELKIIPGLYQLTSGQVSVKQMRDVNLEDLLGRESTHLRLDSVFNYLSGKIILVTGGGGSIGSELCRQIAAHEPGELVIFDIYENGVYDLQQELRAAYLDLKLTVLIGSVRDKKRLVEVFEKYRPGVVYHAAAHKHVPLMEDSPLESIKNNVFGTYNVAETANAVGVERMVLISTDKAVNPTNIMGASKRLCEMIVQSFNRKSSTQYVAVRFGNVLGSNGSVIPLFRKQIERGGPVTVTHPDIIRYFMTIPEAVSLVLQASTMGAGGEIFVLDMGSPVKIADLARNLIKLSGFRPDEDIKIVYSGLRPGEKLYEEKLMDEEGLEKTANELIHIGRPIDFDNDKFDAELLRLRGAVDSSDVDGTVKLVQEITGTYRPQI